MDFCTCRANVRGEKKRLRGFIEDWILDVPNLLYISVLLQSCFNKRYLWLVQPFQSFKQYIFQNAYVYQTDSNIYLNILPKTFLQTIISIVSGFIDFLLQRSLFSVAKEQKSIKPYGGVAWPTLMSDYWERLHSVNAGCKNYWSGGWRHQREVFQVGYDL